MSWLDTIRLQTSRLEAPPEFFLWAGFAALSAVVKRNVYLDRFAYKLYPNIYAMIIADSGRKKSIPMALAKNLVEKVGNTRVISGSSTIQRIIDELKDVVHLENGSQLTDASCLLISEEFTTLIQEDPRAFGLLTTWYDTHAHDTWSNATKKDGRVVLKNLYVTMLCATNEAHWMDTIPEASINGGFLGRTLLIKSNVKGEPNSLVRKPDHMIDYEQLLPYLRQVASLEGEFHFADTETEDFFDEWYRDHWKKEFDDTTGAANRMPDNILKVAMLRSLSDNLSLKLTRKDIEQAMYDCYQFAVAAKNTMAGRGKGKLSEPMRMILIELVGASDNGGRVYKRKLLRRYYGMFDAADLEQIEHTFLTADMITRHLEDGEVFYVATQKVLDTRKRLEKE